MSDYNELNDVLFATLRDLKDRETPDLERARAISEIAQTIINAAKVNVDYIKTAGKGRSDFFRTPETIENAAQPTITGVKHITAVRGGSVTTHKLRG